MKLLRHVLFAVLLLLAQTGALTHAVEHLRTDVDTPTHTCALCIAAQGLDAALVSAPPAAVLLAAGFAPPAHVAVTAVPATAISPRARAPPTIL
jgi:hypothetical protein